jgi:mannose-6-phosphate isomerase
VLSVCTKATDNQKQANTDLLHGIYMPDHSLDPVLPNVPQVRSWGTFTLLEETPNYRINRIEIQPGAVIGWQMHYHRSEHWIVVSGTAKVICGDQETMLQQKQSTYVPTSTPHKVENPGVIPLVMIEVQNGEYLGLDDIIQFDRDPQG